MKNLYRIAHLLFTLCIANTIHAQTLEKDLASFDKIILSPEINLAIVSGDHEKIRVDYQGIQEDQINIIVKGKTLKLFLDKSRVIPKRRKIRTQNYKYSESIYKQAQITAYVTFSTLKRLQVRGEETVLVQNISEVPSFKLKMYGESRVVIDNMACEKFKAVGFGENKLVIKEGYAYKQVYRLFGQNYVTINNLQGEKVKSSIYGESKLVLNAEENLKVNAFGESQIINKGEADLRKGLLLGEHKIH